MALLEDWLVRRKAGARGSKFWASWPVTVDPLVLDDLHETLRGAGDHVRVVINERELPDDITGGGYQSLGDTVRYDTRWGTIRSVALVSRRATVHLGPRTVYAYSEEGSQDVRGVLWDVRERIRAATWKPGAFLYRTWGAVLLVAAAAIALLLLAEPNVAGVTAIWLVLAAGIIYVGGAAVVIVGRRVRFRLQPDAGGVGRWLGRAAFSIFTGALTVVIGAIILAALGFGPTAS